MKHPAKFSDAAMVEIERQLGLCHTVLDPFAGSGRVHELQQIKPLITDDYTIMDNIYDLNLARLTIGVEIEPEWAAMHPRTVEANALALPFPDRTFDAIVTSPCYGNRMADHHEAKDGSTRITYRHVIGHALHPINMGRLQWGSDYRAWHEVAWRESIRVLQRGGVFIIVLSDHIRGGERQYVINWHLRTLKGLGLEQVERVRIPTKRMGFGANADVRVKSEVVAKLRRLV